MKRLERVVTTLGDATASETTAAYNRGPRGDARRHVSSVKRALHRAGHVVLGVSTEVPPGPLQPERPTENLPQRALNRAPMGEPERTRTPPGLDPGGPLARPSEGLLSFVVLLLILAHRYLRLDLISSEVARLQPPVILTALLVGALGHDLARGRLRVQPSWQLAVQWLLCAWAGVCKVVADGAGAVRTFLTSNYLKDVVFLTLVGLLTGTVQRLRRLMWAFVAVMTLVAAVVIPQRSGPLRCHYFASDPYLAQSDGRSCVSVGDCYDLRGPAKSLSGMTWACERAGPLGLSTFTERVRYVGSMNEPNAMSLSLVMACALALGLAFWPGGQRRGSRGLARLGLLGATGLLGLAVLYAASRAGQAGLGLMLLCFIALRFSRWAALAVMPLAAPLVLISRRQASEAAYSTAVRVQTVLNGYQAYLDHPLFGVGLQNYGRISFLNAHNSFILAATETGAPGIGLYVLGLYLSCKLLLQVLRRPISEHEPQKLWEVRHLAVTLGAMLLGVVTSITFESLAFDMMWLFPLGILTAFYRVVQEAIPDYQLHLHPLEAALVMLLGALAPSVMVAAITTLLY